MHKFYEEVVGLEVLMRRDESFVFFKIAEGYGGHTQNLALFEASNELRIDAAEGEKIKTAVVRAAASVRVGLSRTPKTPTRVLGIKDSFG